MLKSISMISRFRADGLDNALEAQFDKLSGKITGSLILNIANFEF